VAEFVAWRPAGVGEEVREGKGLSDAIGRK